MTKRTKMWLRMALLLSFASFVPSMARAQPLAPSLQPAPAAATAPLPPIVTPSRGEANRLADDVAGLPLRLSLMTAMAPTPTPGSTTGASGCGQPSVDAAGTILPVQPHTEIPLTLRLTFHAFSNLGCPGDPYATFDSGAGVGLSYVARLGRNLWLVAAAGTFTMPATGRTASSVGVDLTWKGKSGRTTSVGVGTVGTKPGTRVMARVTSSF